MNLCRDLSTYDKRTVVYVVLLWGVFAAIGLLVGTVFDDWNMFIAGVFVLVVGVACVCAWYITKRIIPNQDK